jgi:hypothetical protein
MRWEHLTFATTDELISAARVSVGEGLRRRVRRDDSEPALAWMDRLAQSRSDWLPAVGLTLHALAADSQEAHRVAVADFFATASIAPALVSVLEVLLQDNALASSVTGYHGGQGAVTLAQLRGPLGELAAGLSTPGWIHFDLKPTRAMDISTTDKRRAAVLDCVTVGRQRTVGGFDGITLGWLRHLAFFNRLLIPELVDHVRGLFEGTDPRGCLCAAEYVALAHDAHWLAPLLEQWLTEKPAAMALRIGVDEPDGWPLRGRQHTFAELGLGPRPSIGDLVAHAYQRAQDEVATAPR